MKEYYVSLFNSTVSLEPLNQQHIKEMRPLSADQDIWTWYTSNLSNADDLEQWMMNLLSASSSGSKMSYAVIKQDSKQVIGSTSYGHIDWKEHCIEVGWTWLGRAYIGTGVNKHMKYLMLSHAFDSMEFERLELRTDEKNIRSRRAMEKIGAIYDGTLRSHRMTQGGIRRNTVIYSILKTEWESIKNTIFTEF